ncbi:twin-arginine translocase subunit TatC [Pseudactinotalea sp. Z1732]|uniref:twin-arginine translocase subunit TatC n=2 Tax=Micrococcales TaxID=85006 RepID=UPI003C797B56
MPQRNTRRRDPEGRMSLSAHLRELRRRFILGAVGVLVGAIAGWFLSDQVLVIMQEPIERLQAEGLSAQLNFQDVTSALDVKVRVSLTLGLILSSPWWMYQVWAFINPGLTTKEKRYTVGFVGAGVPLFVGGVAMAWIALPNTVRLLTQFTPSGDTASNFINATVYLKFVMQFVLIFGFAFLLPLIMVALTFLGVVRGVTWLRGWRWAVILIFVIAALATPTADPVTFILMAIPVIILYFIAVGVCVLRDRSRDKKAAADDDDSAAEGPGDEGPAQGGTGDDDGAPGGGGTVGEGSVEPAGQIAGGGAAETAPDDPVEELPRGTGSGTAPA